MPLQRGPSPEDIAAAVVYLAQAKSVTGTVIAVDGGQHIAWRTADSDVRRVAGNLIGFGIERSDFDVQDLSNASP